MMILLAINDALKTVCERERERRGRRKNELRERKKKALKREWGCVR